MSNLTILQGMIKGMEDMGAKFVKTDGIDMFFDVPKGSYIDDAEKLKSAKEAFTKMFGLELRVRMVNVC